jgi:integrase
MRGRRHQKGSVCERSGVFFLRYYIREEIVEKDERGNTVVKLVPKQVLKRLVEKDDRYHSPTCKAVQDLVAKEMEKINDSPLVPRHQLISDFWRDAYLPYIKEAKRASTVYGYTKLWQGELEPHFRGKTLQEYRTHHGYSFLAELARRMGRNSLSHVRSLASGMFAHATNRGLIERNPWREVRLDVKPRSTPPTEHYTLEEAKAVFLALKGRVDGQLVFAFSCLVGLRPSETAGLRWEDFSTDGWVNVKRGVVGRDVGELKTTGAASSVPLIPLVQKLIDEWWENSGKPVEGWMFPNQKGGPLNLASFTRIVIMPALRKAQQRWKGLYAARRSAATILTQLTGDALAAKEVLRHKDLRVTTAAYVRPIPVAAINGMKLLAEQVAEWSEAPDV